MQYRVEPGDPFRDASRNYHYVIYNGDQFVARYWHDFRGDEQGIIFANGVEDSNGLPGRSSEFISGGGGKPLELTKWAISYIEKCWP